MAPCGTQWGSPPVPCQHRQSPKLPPTLPPFFSHTFLQLCLILTQTIGQDLVLLRGAICDDSSLHRRAKIVQLSQRRGAHQGVAVDNIRQLRRLERSAAEGCSQFGLHGTTGVGVELGGGGGRLFFSSSSSSSSSYSSFSFGPLSPGVCRSNALPSGPQLIIGLLENTTGVSQCSLFVSDRK